MTRRKPKSRSLATVDPKASRINKVLAAAGLGSRRQVEELIVQGRVEIDGKIVTDLSSRVDPQTAKIKVDGETLKRSRLVYFLLNKPKGVLSTNKDPSGRPRVVDYVPDQYRVFSVGRLDLHSEGLVLLTNDGSLAQQLAHPRFRVQKTYFVVVAGLMTPEELMKLRKGVYLAEGVARIDGAKIRKAKKTFTELEIQLSEGKNREIRRILARAGHKVLLLRRISLGPLRLGELPVGAVRTLSDKEIQSLYHCTSAPKSKTNKALASPGNSTQTSRSPGRAVEADSVAEDAGRGRQKGQVYGGHISTPLEVPNSSDFGSGLDDDFSSNDMRSSEEFEFDEGSLSAVDEEIDTDPYSSDEDSWDDDFTTDFSYGSRTGSIIGEDEVGHRSKSNSSSRSRIQKGEQPKKRARKPSSTPLRGAPGKSGLGRKQHSKGRHATAGKGRASVSSKPSSEAKSNLGRKKSSIKSATKSPKPASRYSKKGSAPSQNSKRAGGKKRSR